MLEGVNLAEVAEWVHGHHERPDGRGYPRGLNRRRDSARGAHPGGRRRLRGDDARPVYRPALGPQRSQARARAGRRQPVRRRGRRGVPARAEGGGRIRRPRPVDLRPRLEGSFSRGRRGLDRTSPKSRHPRRVSVLPTDESPRVVRHRSSWLGANAVRRTPGWAVLGTHSDSNTAHLARPWGALRTDARTGTQNPLVSTPSSPFLPHQNLRSMRWMDGARAARWRRSSRRPR